MVALLAVVWIVVVARLVLPDVLPARVGAIALVLLMAFAGYRASRHIRVLGLVLATGSVGLAVASHSAAALWRGLETALPVAAFLPTVVILRAAVEASPAVTRIRSQVTQLEAAGRSIWMTLGSHLLSAIVTLGFASVLRPMLPQTLQEDERVALAQSGIRGLGLAVVWSPFFVAGATAGQLLPMVPAWRIIGFGLLLSSIGMLLALAAFSPRVNRTQVYRAVSQVRVLLLPTAILVGAIVLISALTGWSSLQAIVAVVPVVSVLYLGFRMGARRGQSAIRIATGIGRMGDEVVIMTASVVFGSMIAGHGLAPGVEQLVASLARVPSLVILLEVAVTVALGYSGLHPIVSASVLVPLTMALEIPIAPQVLAHMVTFGWALSSMIAIWTMPVVVSSSLFEVPVGRLALGANLRFVLVFGLVGCALLALLNAWLLGR